MPEITTLPLTTPADVKRYLRMLPAQITGAVTPSSQESVDNALLQILVDAASDGFAGACGRNFGRLQYTERRNGTGTYKLVLINYPVLSIDSLSLIGPRTTATTSDLRTPLVEDVDFIFDSRGTIQLLMSCFPKGVGNVEAVYQAGFATVPSDLKHAATKWCAMRYREFERLGERSRAIGGETVSFDLGDMPPDVAAIVNRYSSKAQIPGASVASSL